MIETDINRNKLATVIIEEQPFITLLQNQISSTKIPIVIIFITKYEIFCITLPLK